MDINLDEREVRVLGSLIEKEMTTPEYYPLSLNALTNACNQKSNRSPVVSYDETAVVQAAESLQSKGLAWKMQPAGSRVPKYLHSVLDRFDLSRQEMAVLCELMLRGPQTVGEIRARAERMTSFESMEEVEKTLQGLVDHEPPLVAKLQREAGRKESRHMHLFSGIAAEKPAAEVPSQLESSRVDADERILRLEEEIAQLRTELEQLKLAFAEFKSQF